MQKKIIKNWTVLILLSMLFLMVPLMVNAAPVEDYTITLNVADFQVNGAGAYATLSAALAICTEAGADGELVIKFGSGVDSLKIGEAWQFVPSNNNLITATYIGKVVIEDKGDINGNTIGLGIPNGVTATFEDLTITNTTADSSFSHIYMKGTGSLNIKAGTSITASTPDGKCIYNDDTGIVTMTEGTLSATGDSGIAIYNDDAGTVILSGGTVSTSGTQDSACAIRNYKNLTISGTTMVSGVKCAIKHEGSKSPTLTINGGNVEATGVGGMAIYSSSNGTIDMSGGVVRATENTSTNKNNYGIWNCGTTIDITGGTVSCAGVSYSSASAIYQNSGSTISISGTTNISGKRYGIYSISNKTNDNGAVYINGGTVTATGVAGEGGVGINNQSTGLITIAAGTVEVPGLYATAVNNNGSGTINMTGGTVQATNLGDTYNCGINIPFGGTVTISGGTVSCAGTNSGAAAIKLGAWTTPQVSNVTISGTAKIIAAANSSIILTKYSNDADKEKATLFGKTIYSDTLADIILKGAVVNGKNEINSLNYKDTTVTASSITNGNSFVGWMSDSARTTSISSTNGATWESLVTGANSGVTDIYLKAGVVGPTVLPTNGSFTDTDNDGDQIGGNITWTAANPTTGITGYKIYWGSNENTKLVGNSNVIYTVAGAAKTSQTVAENTGLPAGATHFLVYSYNAGGDSANCLAIGITDVGANPDAVAVAGAKTALDETDFTYGGKDNKDSVTQNFTLPLTGENGTTISWTETSNYLAIDSATGVATVNRPASGQGNEAVTLTATISKNSENDTKTLTVTIIAAVPITDAQAVTGAKTALDETDFTYGGTDNKDSVTQNFTLPLTGENGTTISWSETSNNITIDPTTGVVSVNRPDSSQGNEAVTLTATISKNSENDTKILTITVIAMPSSGGEGSNNDDNGNSNVGQTTSLGTATTIKNGNQTTTTITVDQQKLNEQLQNSGSDNTLVLSANAGANVIVGNLNGQMIKNMENSQAVVEVRTDTASYTLPAQDIDIETISDQLGQDLNLTDIQVNIQIADTSEETVRVVEDAANEGKFEIMVPPVDFTITCNYNNSSVEVSHFNSYVERTIAIPPGVEPSKISTGIIVDSNGSVRHVPTQIVIIDEKYYAKINSLSNSTYSVIWNPVDFKDVANHWARESINDMGSRMVVSGVGNNLFEPDRDITRAEFASIIVRALGLKPGEGRNPFNDVKDIDWYCESIKTAYAYKIISGYGNSSFGPNDKITREQAMCIIARAIDITDLKVEMAEGEVKVLLAPFHDETEISLWARDSLAVCIKTAILSGRSDKMIVPKENITRAEVAVIVKRLLEKSELI